MDNLGSPLERVADGKHKPTEEPVPKAGVPLLGFEHKETCTLPLSSRDKPIHRRNRSRIPWKLRSETALAAIGKDIELIQLLLGELKVLLPPTRWLVCLSKHTLDLGVRLVQLGRQELEKGVGLRDRRKGNHRHIETPSLVVVLKA